MTRLFGGLLLAAGILVMTTSGLCSLFVVIGGFGMVFQDPTVILLPVIIGGVPFVTGYGLYRWGRSLLRRGDGEG